MPPPPEAAVADAAAKEEPAGTTYAAKPVRYATWIDPNPRDYVVRFGWWGAAQQGSPNKVGEWQSLDPSPFWDLDGLSSDGTRTVDFSATQTDQEGYFGRVNYFGPLVSARVDYEQYLHRLDSWDFNNFPNNVPAAPVNQRVLNHNTLNLGQDYAIRVQEFNAKFHGPLGEHAKWRLNVWGMNKEGERQVSKLGHCFNDGVVLQQPLPRPGPEPAHRLADRRDRAGHRDHARTGDPGILAHHAGLRPGRPDRHPPLHPTSTTPGPSPARTCPMPSPRRTTRRSTA